MSNSLGHTVSYHLHVPQRIFSRMSNELEHARKARIVLGSSLDELFDPSLWSLLNPILKPSLGISRPKTGKLHMVFVLPPLKIWFVGLLHHLTPSFMYLMHCCSNTVFMKVSIGMCTVDGQKVPNVYNTICPTYQRFPSQGNARRKTQAAVAFVFRFF